MWNFNGHQREEEGGGEITGAERLYYKDGNPEKILLNLAASQPKASLNS